ncbi:MAG: VIT1/CCC1 transporter family protein [Actinomycetota bacterium]|nr:VIT1/CCC1 transporter family protein [Actinomycetota bacterium]
MVRRDPHPGHRQVAGGLARAAVFGANDGLVSNVSLILGFAGGGADSSIVRLAGLAGAVAGAVSMAAGEWVSISAQNELIERELAVERRELRHNTAEETAELAAMYVAHGMDPARARDAAAEVMREPDTALVVHAREELGVDPDELASPWQAAALSLVCFLAGALLPVLPWLFDASGTAPTVASVLIGVAGAVVVGAVVARFAERPVAWSIVRQVAIVLGACAVTYAIGEAIGISVT